MVMGILKQKHFSQLSAFIAFLVNNKLQGKAYEDLLDTIEQYFLSPQLESFKLQQLVLKLIHLGPDFESFVSAFIFRAMPDDFTRKELVSLEDELYQFIEKNLLGKELEQQILKQIEEQLAIQSPDLDKKTLARKANGNWGWLIPHVLIYILMENLFKMIKTAVLEDKRVNRKGRIRIKKM